ncbi:UDP-glucose 4-epimerase [Colletotrichum musicola]|uniref:UDP-glucose 4-epimerase n=1 Tax=Colletotrichum musicola TaxID=2175873 RepID=A0A8H6K9B9_9PEZI|nr:UDP-glucose 4-epimerase [Colletotrichum musicola]
MPPNLPPGLPVPSSAVRRLPFVRYSQHGLPRSHVKKRNLPDGRRQDPVGPSAVLKIRIHGTAIPGRCRFQVRRFEAWERNYWAPQPATAPEIGATPAARPRHRSPDWPLAASLPLSQRCRQPWKAEPNFSPASILRRNVTDRRPCCLCDIVTVASTLVAKSYN